MPSCCSWYCSASLNWTSCWANTKSASCATVSLRDRIGHSIHLSPLTSREVAEYLRFRLYNAGYRGGELFTPAACRQLALSSGGLIRRLHLLADKALLAAFSANSTRVRWIDAWRARCDGQRQARFPRFAGGLVAGAAVSVFTLLVVTGPLHRSSPTVTHQLAETPVAHTRLSPALEAARQKALSIQPAAGLPRVSQRLLASQDWLRKTDGGLTIQLLLSDDDNLAKIEKLLTKQSYEDLLPAIYLARSEIDGRPRWNVLYGAFDSKSKALAAIADLPDEMRRHQPFLRSISALRGEHQRADALANKEKQG